MLNFKGLSLPKKILAIALMVTVIAVGATIISYKTVGRVISHEKDYITPFESVEVTIRDFGSGITTTSTTHSVNNIESVKPSDEQYYSPEQWNAILDGIADGSIVWEE